MNAIDWYEDNLLYIGGGASVLGFLIGLITFWNIGIACLIIDEIKEKT